MLFRDEFLKFCVNMDIGVCLVDLMSKDSEVS